MSISVCVAGATGWAGCELARGIAATDDLEVVSAVSRKAPASGSGTWSASLA